jgi:hypothetical protein
LQYNRKQKGCTMQEGDAGTKSLYIPPIRPLSENRRLSCAHSFPVTQQPALLEILFPNKQLPK